MERIFEREMRRQRACGDARDVIINLEENRRLMGVCVCAPIVCGLVCNKALDELGNPYGGILDARRHLSRMAGCTTPEHMLTDTEAWPSETGAAEAGT
jgi:hypothetical protein